MIIGLGFIGVTVVCYWALALIFHKTDSRLRHLSVMIGIWLLVSASLSYFSFFENFERVPPRLGVFAILELIAVFYLVFVSRFAEPLAKISSESVYALQSFRIPVEILLTFLTMEKLLPREMTWHGWNFDVLTGLTALPMAFFAYRGKLKPRIELFWNFAGLALVMTVVITGILSMPTVFQVLKTEPPNFILGYFPFTFLPHFLVPLAIALHLIMIRRLLVKETPV